ncbi:hypothetical protein [Dactylosporangium sp. CA-092794]|uniref:hypothetical protein n=1 Tax=Dactylosporangium sp. CA-092794 TaxID=3239929 RepID=UPI003D8A65E5
MRSFHLRADGRGESRLHSLPLPFIYTGPAATEQDKQGAATAPPSPYLSVCPVRHRDGYSELSADPGERRLEFVTAGTVHVSTSSASAVLVAGDVLLVDDAGSAGRILRYRGDAHTLRIGIEPSWSSDGTVPPAVERRQADPARRRPHVLEMYVADDVAHFRELPSLFGDGDGPAVTQALDGLKFITFSSGHSGDWHTDKTTNIVFVGSGVLELEVGGDNAVELFHPGDVCLVQDLVGQGHILRAHGETRIAAITIPDAHRWNSIV